MNQTGPATLPADYYDEAYYRGHIRRIMKRDRFTRVRMRRVETLLRPVDRDTVVDLGCGAGTMMLFLAGKVARVIGIDYSIESLRIARRLMSNDVPRRPFRGLCCDGTRIALTDRSVDGVVAADFTEHIDDATLDGVVAGVAALLRPGGRFVIYTPAPGHLFEQLKKRNIILREDRSHVGLRPMEQYISLLLRHGFSIDQAFFEPTHLPVYSVIESCVARIPGIGTLARRRICIRAVRGGAPPTTSTQAGDA